MLTNTTELVRFLLARLDDDDATLKARRRDGVDSDGGPAAMDRLRAEVQAKRQIIGAAQQLLLLRDQPCEKPVRDGASLILRYLALPYADHASFRSEWLVTRGH
jgi:hypothetical protein